MDHEPGAGAATAPRAVVLVEGRSDQAALETLAERRGRILGPGGISVVPMGGATNIGRFLDVFGPRGLGVRLAGLCDAAEEGYFRRALERAGLPAPVGALDLTRVPRPLDRVLAHAG